MRFNLVADVHVSYTSLYVVESRGEHGNTLITPLPPGHDYRLGIRGVHGWGV